MGEKLCYGCTLLIKYPHHRGDRYAHCQGDMTGCECQCRKDSSVDVNHAMTRLEEVQYLSEAIERYKEILMPNDGYTTNEEFSPYRCLAYKNEENSEVIDKIVISTTRERARDLFAAELGAEKIKEGYNVQVFPMR